MRKIKEIIIHCSASTFGDTSLIRKWHTEPPRNWRDIGYHYVILNGQRSKGRYNIKDDGLLEAGRELDNDTYIELKEKGAHAKGYNEASIGVCLIGENQFTVFQFETLIKLIRYYQAMIPEIGIKGHYEYNREKTCPNIDILELKKLLQNISNRAEILMYLGKYT